MSALREWLDAIPLAACVLRDAKMVDANLRLAELLGVEREELVQSDTFARFVPEKEQEAMRARHLNRAKNLPSPDDYDYMLRTAKGEPLLVRLRISACPPGGEGAQLYLVEPMQRPTRPAQIIRGLVDVAWAVQREQSEAGIFRAVREQLATLGFEAAICEVEGDKCRLLLASAPEGPLARAFRARGAEWIDTRELPADVGSWRSPQGVQIEDVPALLAALERRPIELFRANAGLRAVGAGIPIDGKVAYFVTAAGLGLDGSAASAFSLFCNQLGTSIETVRQLDELARRNTELLLVNHVARATATLGSGMALQAALDHVAAAVRADGLALFRCLDDAMTLSVSRGFPFGWATSNQRISLRARLPWAEAAAQRETVHYAVEGDRFLRSAPRTATPPHGVRALRPEAPERRHLADSYGVAVPLLQTDKVHGILLLSRRAPAFDGAELELLSTVSAQLAVNLQNEALFDQTQRRVSELSLLLELGQAVVSSLELPKVLAEGARVAVRMLRCSAAYVMVPDAEGNALVCEAASDPHVGGALIGRRVQLDTPSMSALAFKTNQAQSTSNPGDLDPLLVADFGCLSTLAVPLRHGDKAAGVLCLIERAEPRAFDQQDVRLAATAANLIAVALENARLYARERARAAEMTQLNDLSRSLVGAVELQPILHEAAHTLRALVDASNCFITLYDARTRELHFGDAPPEHAALVGGMRISADDRNSLAARALQTRGPVQETHATTAFDLKRVFVDKLGVKSALALPLFARDEPVGVVVLDETRRERVFTDAEIERAQAVCGQIALAMLAARLYEDLSRSHAQLMRTQAELVERERLAVVGELSASIAHEVRNPLGVIFNSIGSLRRMVNRTTPPDVPMLLDIVSEESDRLNRIVGDLLDFARPMTPAVQPTSVQPLLDDAVASARAQLEDAQPVRVRVRVAPEVAQAPADARLLRQAVVNLVINSLQALGHTGQVEVQAERADRAGRPSLLVSVSDTGPGIPPANQQRIFHPFFTTKAKGTGLGLAVVKRIAEGHGGGVAAGDREGGGARLELWIPL